MEPQANLPSVQGHAFKPATGGEAASAQTRARTAVCAVVARYGPVGRLRLRCLSLWPALPDLQRGRRFKSRGLHIEVDTSITSQRLVRIFEQQSDHRLPQVLRTERPRVPRRDVRTVVEGERHGHSIHPSRQTQPERLRRAFQRTFREELLDQHLFQCLENVREAVYRRLIECNKQRAHDSLGDLTSIEHRQQPAGSSTS